MHSNSDAIEITIYHKANKVIKQLLESILNRYKIRLETSMKGSDFIFDCVNLLYYKCHKINLNCGGSYIDSPDQIKTTTTTKNSITDDDKSFQSFAAVAFNHEEIGKY